MGLDKYRKICCEHPIPTLVCSVIASILTKLASSFLPEQSEDLRRSIHLRMSVNLAENDSGVYFARKQYTDVLVIS